MTSVQRGVLLGLAAYAAFAFSDAFIKRLHGSVPMFQLLFLGALLGLIALPMVKRRGERWTDLWRPRHTAIWWMRVAAGVVNSLGALVAFTHLPMAEAFALIFLMPLFVTVLSVLVLDEQVGWRRWTAVVAGFAGVLVVLRPGLRDLHIGHVGAIACGMCGAVGVTLLRKVGHDESRLTLYANQLIGNLAVAAIAMLPQLQPLTPTQWLDVLGYGLLSALGGVLLMHATLQTAVNHVAPTQYSQMIWAVLLGHWLFQDRLDVLTWVGIGIIVATGLFTLIREEHVTGWWHRIRLLLPNQ